MSDDRAESPIPAPAEWVSGPGWARTWAVTGSSVDDVDAGGADDGVRS